MECSDVVAGLEFGYIGADNMDDADDAVALVVYLFGDFPGDVSLSHVS